jgi:hypothetical protein
MIDKDINTIMSIGSSKIFTIDPQQKDFISKSTLDSLIREAKTHLAKKKKVHLVLVKE